MTACHNRPKKKQEDGTEADIIHALLTEDFSEQQNLPAVEENVHEHPHPEEDTSTDLVQTDAAMTTDAATSCDIVANVHQWKSKVAS